jgi:uncharacterized protein (DUF2141 family)
MKSFATLKILLLCAALCLIGSATALAATDPQQLTIRDILTQQTQLRAQVVAGKGAFKGMSKAERSALVERQDRVLQMLGGLQTLEDMAPDQRTVVFNDLEWIKAAVTQAEDDRMVCEYTKIAGSNRMQSVCMTAKEQREHREGARRLHDNGQMCNISREACIDGE